MGALIEKGSMMKLLITGFDCFGGEKVNPAWEAVRLLPEEIGKWRLYKRQIPTVFGKAGEAVLAAAGETQPDAVLCVGLAGGRTSVTPEMVAINLRYARIPDNAGAQPKDEPVSPEGPAAYFTTLPARAMAQAICDAGVPGAVSYSAGAYVCNDVMYTVLHHFAASPVRAGFIHVPYMTGQGEPSLPLSAIVTALRAAIESM